MYSSIYFRNKTSVDSGLNETSLGGHDTSSFLVSTSSPTDKDDDPGSGGDGTDGGGGSGGAGGILTPTTSLRLLLKWYSLIAILSVLVVTGILFAVCRLSLKAEAFRNSGLSSQQDSLLFPNCKASSSSSPIPISIDLDESNDL